MRGICGEEGGKRHWHTHAGTCGDSLPWLLSAQMLSWGGAVNQCTRVCACRLLTVIWGLFSNDSCWHNAPFSLFIYTVQPISISSPFLTPPPPPHLKSSLPSFDLSPVSWYFTSRRIGDETHTCCLSVWATNGCHSPIQEHSELAYSFFSSGNKKKGIIKGVKWEMGEDDSLTRFN